MRDAVCLNISNPTIFSGHIRQLVSLIFQTPHDFTIKITKVDVFISGLDYI